MRMLIGFALAAITVSTGNLAYVLCMTTNPAAIGGWLPTVFFALSPLAFFGFGRLVQQWSDIDERNDWDDELVKSEREYDERWTISGNEPKMVKHSIAE